MTARRAVISIGIFAIAVFALLIILFFLKLNTTISDFSGADAPLLNQMYYNIFHSRPFQVSIFTEHSGQFSNPYPYLNMLVVHSYILITAIIGFFYIFSPGINTMYAVFIILNYAGFAFFTFKIIQRLSPSNAYIKSLLVFSVFLLSGYLRQVVLFGIPAALCGPFILAAYYFLISGKRTMFFLTIVSLCLITDELALFVLTFLAVMWFFEKKSRKVIYPGMVFAAGYFILWNFILQPVIRYDLIPVSPGFQSMFISRFYKMLELAPTITSSLFSINVLIVFSCLYLTILAAASIYLFFGVSRKPDWAKIFSFALFAPAAFWIYGIYSLSGRHLIPVLVMAYIAFIIFLSAVNFNWKKKLAPRSIGIFFVVTVIFLAVNALAMAPALPHSLRCYARKVMRLDLKAEICRKDDLGQQIASNRETIRRVRSIPGGKSVVFWGNYSIGGFISDRNDIWLFPMYYDLADFLILQKDARNSCFTADDLRGLDYKAPGIQDRFYDNASKPVSLRLAAEIERLLVDDKHTHRVAYDDSHLLILERLEHYKFYVSESSVGFGWMRNIPKVFGMEGGRK